MSHKKILLIIIPILLVFGIRYLYHSTNPLYFFFPDTYQYLNRAQEIAAGSSLVNPFRVPLYPFILKNTLHLDGKINVDNQTINAFNYQSLIRFQYSLNLIQAVFFLLLIHRLFGVSWAFTAAAAIFAFDIQSIAWGKNVLPETATSALVVILLFLLTRFVDSLNILYLAAGIIVFSLLFLLRPVYFLLPLSLLPILTFYFLRKKLPAISIITAIFLISSLLVPFYYRQQNKKLYDYPGTTTVSDHNLLAKVIQYNLNVAKLPDESAFDQKLKACVARHTPGQRVELDECIASLGIAQDKYFVNSGKIAGRFAQRAIIAEPFSFIAKSVLLLPQTLVSTRPDPFFWVSTYSSNVTLGNFWSTLSQIHDRLLPLTLLFFLFYPLSLLIFLKNPNRKNTILTIIGTVIAYQQFFNTFFAHTDYIRLRSVIEEPLWLFCFYYFLMVIRKIGNARLLQKGIKRQKDKTPLSRILQKAPPSF